MIQAQNYTGYVQIITLVSDRILRGEYLTDTRVPSVREMAVEMEVNPVTVTRAYERLQRAGALYTQRGLGYFVADGARELIRSERLERFWQETIPALTRDMELLGISSDEICTYFRNNNPQNQ